MAGTGKRLLIYGKNHSGLAPGSVYSCLTDNAVLLVFYPSRSIGCYLITLNKLSTHSIMPNITIDDKSYDTANISKEAQAQLFHLQAIDMEIGRLNVQLAIYKTARLTYAGALKAELEKTAGAEVTAAEAPAAEEKAGKKGRRR